MAVAPLSTPPVVRLDLESFNRLTASGVLEDQPYELLEGELVQVSPPSPSHATVVDRLTRYAGRGDRWLRVQAPLEVPPDSAPEPDLAVLAFPPSPTRHPQDALLAVEVSLNSQLKDRNVKARLYAQAGVPVYWIVDLLDRAVEVRTGPEGGRYRDRRVYREGESVPSPIAGLADLDVSELLRGIATTEPKRP